MTELNLSMGMSTIEAWVVGDLSALELYPRKAQMAVLSALLDEAWMSRRAMLLEGFEGILDTQLGSAEDAIKVVEEIIHPTHTVVRQAWYESERGWGQRPDGASLHLNEADRQTFGRSYRAWGDAECYSREDGPPTLMDVDEETWLAIKDSKDGIWEKRKK